MSHHSGNVDDFGMDTGSLLGSLDAKLEAARSAGFTQIMLAAQDVLGYPGGFEAAADLVRNFGLRITGFHGLQDFEGLAGHEHSFKIDSAKAMLDMCHALDCRLLVVQSSTLRHSDSDIGAIARDLRKLAVLAVPMNIRIAYEAVARACHVNNFLKAADVIIQADMPNLGLAIDSLQMMASAGDIDEVEMLGVYKIFLVQLADSLRPQAAQASASFAVDPQDFRVFPGEGASTQALAQLVTRLHAMGYRGDYSFDAINPDYQKMPLSLVAQRAWRSALWLGEDILRRSVPIPNQMCLKRITSD